MEYHIGAIQFAGAVAKVFHVGNTIDDGVNDLLILWQIIGMDTALPYFAGVVHILGLETEITDQGEGPSGVIIAKIIQKDISVASHGKECAKQAVQPVSAIFGDRNLNFSGMMDVSTAGRPA